ncbi:MAG TPA: TonB-dependent receptor plug domain-containing protein, partial [Steroidobacteraceae bacterium]|nr:TonB-dependent receptor plug domain-containing protein [Steroidobacteraceae bacterium]
MSRSRTSLGLAVLTACAASSVALAQESSNGAKSAIAASDSSVLEEVTVTAQFRKESLQETPVAITAVTAAMLEARNQTTLSDVTAQAPNVILQQNGAGGGLSMRAQIRGIGQTDFDP